jgi:hypothetical protein
MLTIIGCALLWLILGFAGSHMIISSPNNHLTWKNAWATGVLTAVLSGPINIFVGLLMI